MTFKDIQKKSFFEGFASTEIGVREAIIALTITMIIGIYIFVCYRLMTRRTFYSKNFNISLILLAVITAAIILTIQSSVVISLGMVGALSIVRFRTAIKDPMDLVFLFWSISIGIICGAGLTQIAVVLSLIVSVALFVVDKIPVAKAPQILVINTISDQETSRKINEIVRKHCKFYSEKSRNISNGKMDIVLELRVQNGETMVEELSLQEEIYSVSLLKHDGEVTF